MQWETVIGLEIHTQLETKSKIFSGASTAFGAEPNTQACAVDLGLPGVLPVLNKEAVMLAIRFGLGLDAAIAERCVFARKNYFYPDSPKGYQTSQFDLPIVGQGVVEITLADGSCKKIGLTRAHLEEDAGKSLHEDFQGMTGIDLNRAGTPLLEIVSEPDMRSAAEAVAYCRKIHSLVRYLGISDGNMQEGSFRCDANVSVRPVGQSEYGTRAEIKNINSFRFIERAINFEVERQIDVLESGGVVRQETRLYDADKDETRSMRSKEEADDYRYFPCPDLLTVIIEPEMVASIQSTMPELPHLRAHRYQADYSVSFDDARQLVEDRHTADYFDLAVTSANGEGKLTANWLINELKGRLDKDELDLSDSPISAEMLGGLILRLADGTISGKIAKQVFEAMWLGEGDADTVIDAKGLKQITDTGAIEALVDEVIGANPKQVEEYKAGKEKMLGFLVGQIMKKSQGKANPGQVNKMLKEKLV